MAKKANSAPKTRPPNNTTSKSDDDQVQMPPAANTWHTNPQLNNLKTKASEYSPKIVQLKKRWFGLQAEINKIDSLIPIVVSHKSDDGFYHLGIRRPKDKWLIVAGHKEYETHNSSELYHVTRLDLEGMFFAVQMIESLVDEICSHLENRHSIIDATIKDFDSSMSRLGITLDEQIDGEGE